MRCRLALFSLAACTFVVGCASDGRGLRPENSGTKSIVKDTTAPTDETTDEFVDEFTDEFTDEMLPGEEGDGGDPSLSDPEGFDTMSMRTPFAQDAAIPVRFTCDGLNLSPAITWEGLPEGTVEVAIQVVDLEAEDYTHWVIAGLKPAAGGIGEGEVPVGAIQARNSKGTVGYDGLCPPKGSLHNYLFEVDALDSAITLAEGTDVETMLQAVGAATIQSTSMSGTFSR